MATLHFFKSGRVLVLYVGTDNATLTDVLDKMHWDTFLGRNGSGLTELTTPKYSDKTDRRTC
jgi:hypothetical protein